MIANRSAQANVVVMTQPRSILRPRTRSGEKDSTRPTCRQEEGRKADRGWSGRRLLAESRDQVQQRAGMASGVLTGWPAGGA